MIAGLTDLGVSTILKEVNSTDADKPFHELHLVAGSVRLAMQLTSSIKRL